MERRIPLILDVDTGTDDAGALLLAATCPSVQLVATLATWGNCGRDQAARNTLAVLEAAGRSDVPVHRGGSGPSGPAPVRHGAERVMGGDGLGDAGVADPVGRPDPEPAAEALVRLAAAAPGQLTLVALAPLTTIASALALDPQLPGRLHHLVVMGGAVGVGGNATPAAEANIGHDPLAAACVVSAFGQPGALASGRHPCLVPLDVTLQSALTRNELQKVRDSSVLGTELLFRVWDAIWPTGKYETGREDVWPAHDLLATWCVLDPSLCEWRSAPLVVDTGVSAAWGATVADRRPGRARASGRGVALWDIALHVDTDRYHSAVRRWLSGAS